MARISRNAFLVLHTHHSGDAGMGLNFSIVLGAMAAQAVVIFVTHWGFGGLPGVLLSMVLVTPLAAVLGLLTGNLFNRAKGQEMIAGLILGFFAQGIYELIFLQLVGGIIPMDNPAIVMSSGVGVRTTIDLTNGLKYGLDCPGSIGAMIFCSTQPCRGDHRVLAAALAVGIIIYQLRTDRRRRMSTAQLVITGAALAWACWWSVQQIQSRSQINWIRVPLLTWLVIVAACAGVHFFSKTKFGQDMRTASRRPARSCCGGHRCGSGANYRDHPLDGDGSLGAYHFPPEHRYVQHLWSHEQVELYSAAALLIGGATVARATIGHGILGTVCSTPCLCGASRWTAAVW